MYCGKCGKQISDSSSYCPYCGAQVKRIPPRSIPEPEPKQRDYRWARKTNKILAGFTSAMGFLSFILIVVAVIILLLNEQTESTIKIVNILSISSDVTIFLWIILGITQIIIGFFGGRAGGYNPVAVAIFMGIACVLGITLWSLIYLEISTAASWVLLFLCLAVGIFDSIQTRRLCY